MKNFVLEKVLCKNLDELVCFRLRFRDESLDKIEKILNEIGEQQQIINLAKVLPSNYRLYSDKDLDLCQASVEKAYRAVGDWIMCKCLNGEYIQESLSWLQCYANDSETLGDKRFSELQSIRQRALNIVRRCSVYEQVKGYSTTLLCLYHPEFLNELGRSMESLSKVAMKVNHLAKAELVSRLRSDRRVWRVK